MFTKTAIALAIITGIASGVLAASKQSSSTSNRNAFDCRGVYVGSDPKILINRPQNGMCDRVDEE
jgi:hypothetical protein